jgi:hypothetical protein
VKKEVLAPKVRTRFKLGSHEVLCSTEAVIINKEANGKREEEGFESNSPVVKAEEEKSEN